MSNDLLHPKAEAPCLALRPREAAKALGVSERTLWTWTLPYIASFYESGRGVPGPLYNLAAWRDRYESEVGPWPQWAPGVPGAPGAPGVPVPGVEVAS